MRLLHCADLHLGKRINGVDLLPDQRQILQEILTIARQEQVMAVLLAGDIYDKADPPAAAMSVFSDFAAHLYACGIALYCISGNHDSGRRISYLSKLLQQCNVYTAGEFQGAPRRFLLQDEYGSLAVHLLPFLKPSMVRGFYSERNIETYQDALQAVLEENPLDKTIRNVLVCHQFITGAAVCDSEQPAVGGLEQISAEIFSDFDYVALGHLHGPQQIGRATLRYSGSPLPYSFSEVHHKKSVTLVELRQKGQIETQCIPLHPPHPMREVQGTLEQLQQAAYSEDYVRVILTDEDVRPDARVALLQVFPNMLRFGVENSKTKTDEAVQGVQKLEKHAPIVMFQTFYAEQNGGVAPDVGRMALVADILEELEREQ